MKRVLLVIVIMLLMTCNREEQSPFQVDITPSEIEGYELVWHNEFNKGTKPDSSVWSYEYGFVRNRELQWYQQDNARVQDGRLVIEGRRERVENEFYDSTSTDWRKSRKFADYTSSSINTRGRKQFQYGIVEVRARIDTAAGMWPAIWMLGTDSNRNWPANGEIDIMEFYRVDGVPSLLANAAWADNDNQPIWDDIKIPLEQFLEEDPHWPRKFHTWRMEWSENQIRLLLDNQLLNDIDLTKTRNPDGFNPFHQPHYILLNLAIGSNGGDPSQTEFPGKYEVDYVRVYQEKIDNE